MDLKYIMYLLSVLITGTVFIYIILFRCMRARRISVKNPKEISSFISVTQKNLILFAIIIMYLCIFAYSINGELRLGNGISAGIKTGLLMALANTFRPISVFFYLNFSLILYQDKKFKEQKKLAEQREDEINKDHENKELL